ncbi:MAG TPA: hypothetical protein DHV25_03130 [Candidatus Kerfeldbacteria bacterium]|nr:hypothetical protein [Candidatus Kerfeldbacteria bacterium]
MIRTAPLEHQKNIVAFSSPLEYSAIVSGYGSGKTLSGLWLMQVLRWKLVVVISTKTSIEATWTEQIKEHSSFRFALVLGTRQQKIKIIRMALYRYHRNVPKSQQPTLILLVNFDGVKNIYNTLVSLNPDAVIVDEPTKIKSPDALRTQVLWSISKYFSKRHIMGGNLFTENLTELYAPIKFLDHGATFGNSYDKFLQDFFKKKKGRWEPKPGAEKKILKMIEPFCITVPDDVVKLPPASRKIIKLTPSKQQRELIEDLHENFKVELGRVKLSITSAYSLYIKEQQICDGFITDSAGHIQFIETPKDEALIDILEEIGMKEKSIIWTSFIPSIKKLERLLTALGYGVLTLYGETKDVRMIQNKFNNSPRYQILLTTYSKGNESLNLQKSRFSFRYSQTWSNDQKSNSAARNRRKGSLEAHKGLPIMYHDFLIRDSVDEIKFDNVKSKSEMVQRLKKYFNC